MKTEALHCQTLLQVFLGENSSPVSSGSPKTLLPFAINLARSEIICHLLLSLLLVTESKPTALT